MIAPEGASASNQSMTSLVQALLSPLALARLPARSWVYLVVYLLLAAGLLFVTAWQLGVHQNDIEGLLLDYLFPDSWHLAASELVGYLFSTQHRAVVINALVTSSLMVVTLTLFPIKEKLSASFESGARLVDEPMREHPLWEQGWQEIKLFLLFVAVQGTIFLIGLLPHPAWRYVAIGSGYLFLWLMFAVDFISPLFQRHEGHYSRVFKTLLRRPLAALVFGAMFSAPVLIVGKLWEADSSWSWNTAIFVLFGVNVVGIVWAAVSGTWLAAKLFPVFARVKRSSGLTRKAATAIVVALLLVNGYIYASLGLAVHHKSQILKCEYDVDFSSIDIDAPGITAMLANRVEMGVSVDVLIRNPTAFDVEIEDNEVVVAHRGEPVARTRIAPVSVPAGASVTQRLAFSLEVKPSVVAKGRELFDREMWQLTLYVDIAPYVRMPIALVRAGN